MNNYFCKLPKCLKTHWHVQMTFFSLKICDIIINIIIVFNDRWYRYWCTCLDSSIIRKKLGLSSFKTCISHCSFETLLITRRSSMYDIYNLVNVLHFLFNWMIKQPYNNTLILLILLIIFSQAMCGLTVWIYHLLHLSKLKV